LVVTAETPPAETEAIRASWEATWKAYNWNLHPDPWTQGARDHQRWIDRYAGHAVLAPRSSRQALRCRIRLEDAAQGLKGGGRGECQVSGGGDIKLELGSR
jgi:hypothetical protein